MSSDGGRGQLEFTEGMDSEGCFCMRGRLQERRNEAEKECKAK